MTAMVRVNRRAQFVRGMMRGRAGKVELGSRAREWRGTNVQVGASESSDRRCKVG